MQKYIELRTAQNQQEAGVQSATKDWMEHFKISPSSGVINQLLFLSYTTDAPATALMDKQSFEFSVKDDLRTLVAYPSTDWKVVRDFLRKGVTYIAGPDAKEWESAIGSTWVTLSSVFEPKADYWYPRLVSYYYENWPALLSPAEWMCREIDAYDITPLGLAAHGVMPAKWISLNQTFETSVGSWDQEEWIEWICKTANV